jgi:hypothetical protein
MKLNGLKLVFDPKPLKPVVWTTKVMKANDAAKALVKEQANMARKGYALQSQIWAPEHHGRSALGTIVKAGIFLPLVLTGGGDNGKGRLTATFVQA